MKQKMTDPVTIRTSVERDVYKEADAKAKAQGTNLAAVLRDALIAWANQS